MSKPLSIEDCQLKQCNTLSKKYEWQLKKGQCSQKCGNGSRLITSACVDISTQQQVLQNLCTGIEKPLDYSVNCFSNCFNWKVGEWTEVSS